MRLYMGCLPFEINHGRHFSPDWWYQSGLKTLALQFQLKPPTGTKEGPKSPFVPYHVGIGTDMNISPEPYTCWDKYKGSKSLSLVVVLALMRQCGPLIEDGEHRKELFWFGMIGRCIDILCLRKISA